MSRRDLIIIAALINAGLLIVLFATSLKSDRTEEPAVVPAVAAVSTAPAPSNRDSFPAAPVDEVDQMLKQFAAGPSAPSAAPASEGVSDLTSATTPIATVTAPQEQSAAAPTFAEELNALPFDPTTAVVAQEPAPALSPQEAEAAFIEVKVKKGDFLDRIAKRNGSSVAAIMKCNHLTSTNLKIGQVLKIPRAKGSMAKAASRVAPAASGDQGGYYIVKRGDNPWTIAAKNKIKVADLLRLNNLDQESARQLKAGDRLRIR